MTVVMGAGVTDWTTPGSYGYPRVSGMAEQDVAASQAGPATAQENLPAPQGYPLNVGAWQWPPYHAVHRSAGLLLPGAIVTGVLFDLALRSGAAALGLAAAIWAAAVTVLAWRRTANPWVIACFGAALVLAAGLVLRASPWLVAPDVVAICFLLVLGAILGTRETLLDLRWSAFCARLFSGVPLTFWVPGWLGWPVARVTRRLAGSRRSDALAVARGVAIAIPILLVLGALLASADPVFASFLNLSRFGNPADLLLHVVLVATGILLVGILAGAMAIGFADAPPERVWPASREALVVMAAIDVLFALFAVAQLVAALGGGAAALHDANITYSDYARSGFFQLLWVAALSWIVVLLARRTISAESGRRRLALIAAIEVAVCLVLLIVYVAHARLQLYEEAYGFTMLRLYSHVFAGFAAAAFVLLGVSVAGLGAPRRWLFGAVAALALLFLVGLNAVSPESVVVGQNLDRAHRTGKLDHEYLASLSDDAIPAALAGASGLDATLREPLQVDLCANRPGRKTGWESYTAATDAAMDARRQACGHP
jgi:two-component system, OmpR family, sensor histidine kinase BaeS